jgi:hypothetical protein
MGRVFITLLALVLIVAGIDDLRLQGDIVRVGNAWDKMLCEKRLVNQDDD